MSKVLEVNPCPMTPVLSIADGALEGSSSDHKSIVPLNAEACASIRQQLHIVQKANRNSSLMGEALLDVEPRQVDRSRR